MDKMQREMKNMKNDMKEGAQKVGHVMKHTAEDLKDDVMGAMASMEMKKEIFKRIKKTNGKRI